MPWHISQFHHERVKHSAEFVEGREKQLAVSAVSQNEKISERALLKGLAQQDTEQSGGVISSRPITPVQQRIRQLEKENQRLKQSRANEAARIGQNQSN